MAWKAFRFVVRRGAKRSRLHLDESVPASVEPILIARDYHATTTKSKRMAKRSDEEQAALAWREKRTLLTFDLDFLDPTKLPQTRNPGVIIVDCDRGKIREVERAIDVLAAFERFVGPVTRKMRIIVRPDGEVSVWKSTHPRFPPDVRYRFIFNRPPEVWFA